MPGSSTTNSSQSGTTAPWQPAQPLLQNIISTLGAMPASLTPQQTSGYGILNNEAGTIPNFGPAVAGAASNALNTTTQPQQNILTGANNQVQSWASPYLSSSYLNPLTTPGLSTQLQGLTNTISNTINGEFAGAGRTGSPANTTALAYGLEQGEAPVLTNQYNANVAAQQNAGNTAFGAANTTATGLTQQQLDQILAGTSGANLATAVPGLATAPGTTAVGAANAAAQQPFSNLGWLSSLAYPVGALGGQSTAQGTSTTSLPWTSVLSAFGGGTGINNLLFSDADVKEDIKPIGMLYDATPVYSYRYVKELDPEQKPRIGLLAQDVEKTKPEAVVSIGGVKALDYGKATEKARYIGMLGDMAMAA